MNEKVLRSEDYEHKEITIEPWLLEVFRKATMWEFFFLSLFLLSLQFFLSFFSIFLSYILSGSLYVFLLSIFSFLYNLFFLSFFLFHSLYVFLSFLFTMCLFLVEKNCPSETFLQLEHGGNKNDVWHGLSKCLNMWE